MEKQNFGKKKCAVCGKIFEAKSTTAIVCSTECRKIREKQMSGQWREEHKKEKVCKWCGKTFIPKNKESFCSDDCKRANSIQKNHEVAERRKKIGGMPGAKLCPECGKVFYPTKEWVYKRGEKVFCSWTCYRAPEKRRKRRKKK